MSKADAPLPPWGLRLARTCVASSDMPQEKRKQFVSILRSGMVAAEVAEAFGSCPQRSSDTVRLACGQAAASLFACDDPMCRQPRADTAESRSYFVFAQMSIGGNGQKQAALISSRWAVPPFGSPSTRDHSSASQRKSGAACIFDRGSLGAVRREGRW
jgi:hypothetical protein